MKRILIITTIAAGLASLSPAHAAVYNYETFIGNGIGKANVSIDTSARTATWSGSNINLQMTDSQLANFKGGNLQTSNKTPSYTVDSVSGTFSRYGRDYTAFSSTSPKHTQFELASNRSFLWLYGRDKWGRTFDFDGKGRSTTYTGSTGGSTGSTGGTPVPAPGMLGLLGLGLAALAFGRRKTIKAEAVKAQPAFA